MDYTEDDRWDWDRNDPNQFCRHGTFIGSWWGPDILCGQCESGEQDPTLRDMVDANKKRIRRLTTRKDQTLKILGRLADKFNGFANKDEVLAALSEEFLKVVGELNEQIGLIESEIEWDKETYLPLCEDGSWDDPSILAKKHSADLDAYYERKADDELHRQQMESVRFDY